MSPASLSLIHPNPAIPKWNVNRLCLRNNSIKSLVWLLAVLKSLWPVFKKVKMIFSWSHSKFPLCWSVFLLPNILYPRCECIISPAQCLLWEWGYVPPNGPPMKPYGSPGQWNVGRSLRANTFFAGPLVMRRHTPESSSYFSTDPAGRYRFPLLSESKAFLWNFW